MGARRGSVPTMGGMGGQQMGGGINQARNPNDQPKDMGNNNSVTFESKLGEGVFGEVWKAKFKGKPCAVKVTFCPSGFRPEELDLLKRAQGPYTIKLLSMEHRTPKGTAIVMTLCDSSLDDVVAKRRGGPNDAEFLQQVVQILEGLQWMHNKGLIFGDLKPDNLLMDQGRIVFADFGDARDASKRDTRPPQEQGWGSPKYHARPDVMQQCITVKSDIWMLGQTAIHLWTGRAAETNPSPVPSDIPMRAVVQACLSQQADRRPSAKELLMDFREAVHVSTGAPSPTGSGDTFADEFTEAQSSSEQAAEKWHSERGLKIGDTYIIQGIQARPELNGQACVILKFLPKKDRYSVELVSTGEEVAMKPNCLREEQQPASEEALAKGQFCEIHGIHARPELNGQECTVLKFLIDKDRYSVQLKSSGEKVAIKKESLRKL